MVFIDQALRKAFGYFTLEESIKTEYHKTPQIIHILSSIYICQCIHEAVVFPEF